MKFSGNGKQQILWVDSLWVEMWIEGIICGEDGGESAGREKCNMGIGNLGVD